MAKSFNELMQDFVNKPYEELLGMAKEGLNRLMPEFDKIANDGNGAAILVPMINVMLAIDNKFNDKELKFINDFMGKNYSFEEIKNMLTYYQGDDWVNAIDTVVDKLSTQLKSTLLVFLTCFAAVDERISVEETAFIKKLLVE